LEVSILSGIYSTARLADVVYISQCTATPFSFIHASVADNLHAGDRQQRPQIIEDTIESLFAAWNYLPVHPCVHKNYCNGPSNKPVLLCSLASVVIVVVCNTPRRACR